ncbi:electron transport complex subunit RsxC [Marinomonas dokdonensis]|uniref:electron transport complex subunit RsxC n=1 Tax=Marinomonas dokdonensis TaxID=328224 RepID=UPI00405541B3
MQTAVNIFSFHGGIHPPENKTQSLQLPLGRPSLPAELILPLGQHIGQSSRPIVEVGTKVLKGQPIAINNGFLSSFLHAPTSGTIEAIEPRLIAHPSGLSDLCIVLTPDGQDTWQDRTPLLDWQSIPHLDTLTFLGEMGIVGMGGAGFPTQVKLQGAHKHAIKHFIINAAECEPYITADDMLIREKTDALIQGIEVLQHLVQAEQMLIGIEDNKPTAIAALKQTIQARNSAIQVAVVPTKYPSGGEKQLIQLLTGKEVPSGQYPADIGVLCQNVGTCVAVHDAIYLGQPLISRFTTLTGDALGAPQNVEVLLGTPIEHLLDYAQADQKRIQRLVMGGPMMGFTLNATEVPIVKTSNCILAATAQELPTPEPEQACIRCGMCEQACPASLLPQQLLWFSKSQELEKAEHYNLFDCIECGACSYVCPSSIPLVQYYRHSKSTIRENREAAIKSDIAKQRFEARKARQEAEIAEKEAKRLARQQASTKKTTDKPAPTAAAPSKAAASPAAPISDDAKKLKIDVAIGKTKLKKLQKQLLAAQESEHLEEINALQLQVTDLEGTLAKQEAELAKLAPAPVVAAKPAPAAKAPVSDELKKAKVDVALIGVKLKKLQKQLDSEPDNTELQDKIKGFNSDLEAAQALVTKLSASEVSTAPVEAAPSKAGLSDEAKKLKIDAAIAKAAVKKVEKALRKAEEIQSPGLETLRQQLKDAQQRADELEQALNNPTASASAAPAPSAATSADADAQKKRKVDLAIAKAGIKKAEKNIALLKEQGKDDSEIAASEWPQKLQEAQQKLAQLESADAAPTQAPVAEKAPAAKAALDADAEKKRKIDLAIAKAGIKKAEKNIALLKEQGKDDSEIAASEWPQKLQEAQQKLAQLESADAAPAQTPVAEAAPAAKAAPVVDADAEKKRKIDLAIAKAGIKKAEKNIALLKEQGKDDSEIAASEWPQKLQEAQQKLAQLEKADAAPAQAPIAEKAPAAKAAPVMDADAEKKLKIDLAIAKAGIKKAEKNIALLKEQGKDDSEIAESEWPQKLQEAQAKLEQLTHAQESR